MSKIPPAWGIVNDILDKRPNLFSYGATLIKSAVLADDYFIMYIEKMVEEYMGTSLESQETLRHRGEVVNLLIRHFASAAEKGAAAAKLKLK
jgi:hypothetical protein